MNSNVRLFLTCIKQALIIFAVLFLLVFLGFCLPAADKIRQSMNAEAEGHEFPAADGQKNLGAVLRHYFNWSELPTDSVTHASVHGFLDPGYLYRANLPLPEFLALKASIASQTHNEFNDSDTLDREPFRDVPQPWKPGTWKKPAWWDVKEGKTLDVVEWIPPPREDGQGGGIWLAYDNASSTLFVYSFSW
jgi:hypothetical protein